MVRILYRRTSNGTLYRVRCRPEAPGRVRILQAYRRPPWAERYTRAELRGVVPWEQVTEDEESMADVFGAAAVRRVS